MPPLTTIMTEKQLRPYFLWDDLLTIGELHEKLRSGTEKERLYYMARILREARYEDVWEFLTVSEVVQQWESLSRQLGRREKFWKFLFSQWREHGLIQ